MKNPPEFLYRFFDHEVYADDFCRGKIRISTFSICRQTEDAQRRDPYEGTDVVAFDDLTVDGNDRESAEYAARAGFRVSRGQKVTMLNCFSLRQIADAYVLCFSGEDTDYMRKKMGAFGVRIRSPLSFFHRLSDALAESVEYRCGAPGAVEYKSRLTNAPDPVSEDFIFIKPRSFKDEKEHRFVWLVEPGAAITYTHVNHAPLGEFTERC